MDENIKKGIKKLAENAEIGAARSILRWKYKKEGRGVPGDDELKDQSLRVAVKAHEVIRKRGKNVWNELKKVYAKNESKGDSDE